MGRAARGGLDDEPLIFLDPRTGRGYALTVGGVGDNFQVHILLADRLVGDPARGLVPGEQPAPAWVDAATTGNPLLDPRDPVIRAFRLFDGRGSYLYPEGIPAAHMPPSLPLDRILPAQVAAEWLRRVAPAIENDLTAR